MMFSGGISARTRELSSNNSDQPGRVTTFKPLDLAKLDPPLGRSDFKQSIACFLKPYLKPLLKFELPRENLICEKCRGLGYHCLGWKRPKTDALRQQFEGLVAHCLDPSLYRLEIS